MHERPQCKRKVAIAEKKLGAECISLAGSWPDFWKTRSPGLGDRLWPEFFSSSHVFQKTIPVNT